MGSLSEFFYSDHRRLAELLDRSLGSGVNAPVYGEFREGLLAHFAMEERCVLPAIVDAKGGQPLLTARRVRAEHRAIRCLLALPPTAGVVGALRKVLMQHELLEDGPGGLYESCEALLGPGSDDVLRECREFHPDPVQAVAPEVNAYDEAVRALSQAGFTIDEAELR